jgi:hypothetical protein
VAVLAVAVEASVAADRPMPSYVLSAAKKMRFRSGQLAPVRYIATIASGLALGKTNRILLGNG